MANPQKIKARVSEIIPYGKQVYKLTFSIDKKFPRFKAGQFLHLTLDAFDPTTGFWPESRVFSIASCSENRNEITIVYSVKGKYTQRIEDELKIGSEVWLKAPYGEFIISNFINEETSEIVLIAGGTGISPYIPFFKIIGVDQRINLNYGLRNKDLIIFNEELSSILKKTKVKLNLYFEENSDEVPFKGNVFYNEGCLSIEKILSDVVDVNNSVFFISGPPNMINTFKCKLISTGINIDKIIIDEWS